jgi:hypothetical protein
MCGFVCVDSEMKHSVPESASVGDSSKAKQAVAWEGSGSWLLLLSVLNKTLNPKHLVDHPVSQTGFMMLHTRAAEEVEVKGQTLSQAVNPVDCR